MGFFTDTSVCIGCKACEVACKEWNHVPEDGLNLLGMSYDNTGGLGASTWRHVAFIEQIKRPGDAPGPGHGQPDDSGGSVLTESALGEFSADGSRWLMASNVCKHCTESACLDVCPTGALMRTEFGTVVVQEDVCNGCGYCVSACPFGVIERREGDGRAWKCTLCYDRIGDGLEPACAKACPTQSIQFGPVDELRDRARQRVDELHEAGETGARLYLEDPDDGISGGGAFFLLLDEPEVYGLPPDPVDTTRDLPRMWRHVATAAGALVVGGLAAALRPEGPMSRPRTPGAPDREARDPQVRATAMSLGWRPASGSGGACTAGVSTSGTGRRRGPWTVQRRLRGRARRGALVVAGPVERPSGGRHGGARNAGGEQFVVPRARPDSYYGKPIIKEPVWGTRDVGGYLFLGGLAGASAVLAGFAQATGNHRQARVSKVAAVGAVGLSGVALVADLGRPERFVNMLRVFKPTSPMSVGSWLLSGFGGAAVASAACAVTGRLPRAGAAATAGAAVLGPGVCTYTAALICDTAVPAWHEGHREMPYLFAGSAASAAGGLGMLATPGHAGLATRFAALGAVTELTAKRRMMDRLGETGEPYRTGRPGKLLNVAEVLTVAGAAAALLGGGPVLGGGAPGGRRRDERDLRCVAADGVRADPVRDLRGGPGLRPGSEIHRSPAAGTPGC